MHSMVLLYDEAQVDGGFGPFGDSANLDATRCMVCAEDTTGSEIILDTLDRTPRCMCHMESPFSLFRGSVSIGAR
jgi:hypothetical protein